MICLCLDVSEGLSLDTATWEVADGGLAIRSSQQKEAKVGLSDSAQGGLVHTRGSVLVSSTVPPLPYM